MNVLVIAEHDRQGLKSCTLSVITAAVQLGDRVDVLVAGYRCDAVVDGLLNIKGVADVIVAEHETYSHQLAETVTPLVMELVANYSYVLAAATTTGKNLLPRIAALLDVAQISEIVKVLSEDTFVRPVYAGNALATVQSSDSIKVITVRTTAFDEAASDPAIQATVVPMETVVVQHKSTFVGENLARSERPELPSASIVIAGGRGMQSRENFQILERIADKLGAAIGASRAAVDAGFVSNDLQVGQTGKIVAPDLYIAVGISGAIQHLAGMKDSKIIVAINRDADAPIFQIADYGLVADLFQVLDEIEALI